jgi:hypothetical protein
MMPVSAGIVVNLATMKGAYAAKMPNRQVRFRPSRAGERSAFVYEALKQCVYGNTELFGFVGKPCFGFWRDFDTHALSVICVAFKRLLNEIEAIYKHIEAVISAGQWAVLARPRA